ncbi:CLUMA_CG005594, isoform A [Clunio marinus]|uniref:CLUMA_CG005594, isoform A n=1 Tax=Clunio marinus TaxID=568069 RepID=A0A1J1HZP5_9DIPT|nr:CLUMA_CG005594, isoform A [Clunio marinus]
MSEMFSKSFCAAKIFKFQSHSAQSERVRNELSKHDKKVLESSRLIMGKSKHLPRKKSFSQQVTKVFQKLLQPNLTTKIFTTGYLKNYKTCNLPA